MKVDMKPEDQIEPRQVGDAVPEIQSLDPGLGQYQFGDLAQFVEFSKVMCQAGAMLPEHAQRNPAICLALTMRAVHWGFDPFALAFESFQAKNGGPIGFQAKVFTAVMRKAGVRLSYRYEGTFEKTGKPVKSAKGNVVAQSGAVGDRKCIAYLEEDGRVLEYETPTLDEITIKNSPLWHNDPDQQLAYYAGRGWARRFRSDLMLGAYSDDEVQDMRQMRDVTPKQNGFAQLGQTAREKASTEAKQASDPQSPSGDDNDTPAPDQDAQDGDQEQSTTHDDDAPEGEVEIDAESPAYQMGAEAAKEGFISRDQGPFNGNDEATVEQANWLAGFDSVENTA
ncbi:recombinase RecT [Roseovarius sp. MMSF_3281]|uniref:recombinase RecT n=1 Tax=Roseovarius sp. MMSF_3281 TaxID=3046694 RepID=UPI00273E8019|nr:recombinase RecT [Roseovarius sp. MMSF_3281]